MQVYPAAGLINYVKAQTKIYYIDPNPATVEHPQVTVIAEKASSGLHKINLR
jgi:NAD-dependent deacetylase